MKLDRFFAPFTPPPNTNVVDVLDYWASQRPDQAAFYFSDGEGNDEQITYAQLQQASRSIAVALMERQLTGKQALLMFPPGLDFVKAFFGCMCAGVVAVPAFTPRRNRNVKRLQAISDDAEARVALTVADVRDRAAGMLDDTPSLKELEWLAVDRIPMTQATLGFARFHVRSTGTAAVHIGFYRDTQRSHADPSQHHVQRDGDRLFV